MTTKHALLSAVSALVFIATLLAGCSGNDAPVSPNAKTAAPARLPGEDPHAPPARVLAHKNDK
jgi:hypothetical protein